VDGKIHISSIAEHGLCNHTSVSINKNFLFPTIQSRLHAVARVAVSHNTLSARIGSYVSISVILVILIPKKLKRQLPIQPNRSGTGATQRSTASPASIKPSSSYPTTRFVQAYNSLVCFPALSALQAQSRASPLSTHPLLARPMICSTCISALRTPSGERAR
jgi:hypothetical protein